MPSYYFYFYQFSFTTALILSFAGTRLDAKRVTVDDADTKVITYSSGWKTSNNCPTCFAKPNKTQAFDKTWHDGTANSSTSLSFTFGFTGTYIEARYIALDIIGTTVATGTNVSYTIDGVQRGTASHNPADRNAYIYNQSLFNVAGLTNAKHTLRVDLLTPSVLLLDSLIYDDGIPSPSQTTTSLGTSPASSTSNGMGSMTKVRAIIGGIVAAVIVLVLGVVLVWYFIKRRQSSQRSTLPIPGPERNAPPPPQFLPTTGSNPSRVSLVGTNLVPTTPSSSLAGTYVPSLPGTHHWPRANKKAPLDVSPYSVHGTTTRGAPPSRPYPNVVANRIQDEIPDEPVEGGLISRQTSLRSILPPYSPGGFPG